MLLAGSDLISTMSEPGVWSDVDVSRALFYPQLPFSSLHDRDQDRDAER